MHTINVSVNMGAKANAAEANVRASGLGWAAGAGKETTSK